MSDLLEEYKELIHEPTLCFENETIRVDGTVIYETYDVVLQIKKLRARRDMLFRNDEGDNCNMTIEVSMDITEEMYLDSVVGADFYEEKLIAELNEYVSRWIMTKAEEGWEVIDWQTK